MRFQTSSSILVSMDNIGYIFGKSIQDSKSDCDQDEQVFSTENINLTVRTSSLNTCFTFGSSGSICLPEAGTEEWIKPCSIHVASSFTIEPEKSNIFPDRFGTRTSSNTSMLGDGLIGLTIDNGSIPIELTEDSAPFVVTFVHEDSKVWHFR